MEQLIGKVIEVFIPDEDVMNSKRIGFRVQLEKEEITIIEEQDEYNSKILKNDKVIVIKKNILGQEFISIELYNGDEYE